MEEYTFLFTELETQLKDIDNQKKFNLLINTGLGRSEKLHSNLISDFLKLNKKYFDLFLEQIGLEPGFIEFNDAKIYRELPAGGYVDIFIRYKNKIIIIENKVDDRGKSGQLQKYCESLQEEFGNRIAPYYLTKYGELPPKDRDCDYKCLSYEKDIVKWLEKCIKETTIPTDNRIKVSLEIYVELVRNIINRDKYMEEVLDYLKKDPKKMSLAIDIYKTLNGRNFFEDPIIFGQIQKRLLEGFKEIPLDLKETDWWQVKYKDREWGVTINDENEVDIGVFYFTSKAISAETTNGEEIKSAQIIGNELLNENLQALLSDDKEKINIYLYRCIQEMRDFQK